MLRLRMPGGRVTKEKLKFLVDSIERYDVKRAHIDNLPDSAVS